MSLDLRTLDEIEPQRDVAELGEKATLLAHAVTLGLDVPPALSVSRGVVARIARGAGHEVAQAIVARLTPMEGPRPFCVAVRPSTDQRSPGVQPTILDVGATRDARASLAQVLESEDAAADARLRFLRGLARARGIASRTTVRGVRPTTGPTRAEMDAEIAALEPQLGLGPEDGLLTELRVALEAVAAHGAPLLVQAMRFGTARGGLSGAGTASSRHPITGEPVLFGELAWDRQGEDVSLGRGAGVSLRRAAAGRRGDESLEARAPDVLATLAAAARAAEASLDGVIDLEVVVERGALFVVQLRRTVLTPRAEARVMVDRVDEGSLTRESAVARVGIDAIAKVGRVELVSEEALGPSAVLGRGLGASPGAASGRVAIEVEDAVRRASAGERVVLVRSDASPEDAPAVRAAVAVATSSGGLTSHAAVMSRALGRPCAVSVSNLRVRPDGIMAEGRETTWIRPGDLVTVDGTRGLLVRGVAATRWVCDDEAPSRIASWARAMSSVRVLVEDRGGVPAETAGMLDADGVWNGRTAIDLSGVERPEWGAPAPWNPDAGTFPDGGLVVVEPTHVAAARVAAVTGTSRDRT